MCVPMESDSASGGVDQSLRSFTITLPELCEPGGDQSMLAAGDWIAQLRPHIADICSGASTWWDNVIQLVSQRYEQWLQANPLERAHITPPDSHVVSQGHTRLEQRVTNMLHKALPETIRAELVSTRLLHVSGIMFTVHKRYQPGGLAERSQTLLELTCCHPIRGSAKSSIVEAPLQ